VGLRAGFGGNFFVFFRWVLYNYFVGVRAVTVSGQRPQGWLIRGLDRIFRGDRKNIHRGCWGR